MYHVYVRDRKSFNGTYVNGVCIGDSKSLSRGYLLNDGDAIELRPHWKFVFNQVWLAPSKPLTTLQLKECELFKDRYEVLPRTLGEGAEAAAHLAIEVATKKQLVCKLINVGQQAHRNPKKALRSALQEADVLRQLHHPNILSYIDAICSPHSVYIFNELASGGDLFSFIRRHDTVTEFDSRIFLRQITRGLRFLHGKGITHRDLKPENILLANSPKIAYQRVLLSDFGACAIPKRSRMTSLVGTSTYQAPELCSKEKHTSAVDIWSLGIVTITLLTGESSVFSDVEELNQAALNTHVTNFLRERNSASSLAESFIIECLQICPPDRLTSTEAQHHDWLCTPAKHVEFFEELDRRMLESWSVHNELVPMPMELPDVTQSTQSQSQIIPATPSQLSQVTDEGQSSARQTSLERKSKRVKLLEHLNIKVPDHLHLPLNSLDKHLKEPPSQNYREKVLQQLQDSQTKFLA